MNIQIISRPDGEAPEEIRDKWIGLILPVDPEAEGVVLPVAGIVSNEFAGRIRGYAVFWDDAMAALDAESRHWFQQNVAQYRRLIFDEHCCEVVN